MKMTNDQLHALSDAISQFDTPELRTKYQTGNFHNSDKVKDLNTRYRWDLVYIAKCISLIISFYDTGLNDEHIDTALRKIVKNIV